jgi:Ca-activated chloride channel family protein
VVTDGADTVSSKNYHDALRAAHDADAVVYGILVMPITNDAGRHVAGEHALTGLAQSTGGKMFTPGLNALDVAFDEILRDLRTQYLLGFYPKDVPPTKNAFHRIEIRAARPELRVVSRTGYYGEAQASSR